MTSLLTHRWIRPINRWLWQPDIDTLPGPQRVAVRIARVLYAVARDIGLGQTNLHAMSLVYTTLLSIVPFLALSFSVLKGFGVHNQLEPILQNLLLAPLGDKSREITDSVLAFVDNIRVGVLGAVGLSLLVYTVVSLVQKVEKAFNEAWRVGRSRPLSQRFANYLSVILIGPLLAFSALGATATFVGSELVSRLQSIAPLGWLMTTLSSLAPYGVIILLFSFLYVFIPNTRVQVRHALIGGAVAGTIWQTVGYAFTVFVVGSTRFTAIYSGFAVGVLLLVWIYMAWLILLTGATVAYYSQHVRQIGRRRQVPPSARTDETVGLLLVHHVGRNFDQGRLSERPEALSSRFNLDPALVDRLVRRLIRNRILERTERGTLVPAKPLDRIALSEVLDAIRRADGGLDDHRLPEAVRAARDTLNGAVEAAFTHIDLGSWVRQDRPSEAVRDDAPDPDH